MQIAQVLVGNVLYSLVEGQPLPISTGETLRVYYSFKYSLPESGKIRIWASLYQYTVGILDRATQAQTKGEILLEKSLIPKEYSGTIDITIGSINSGTYGLICELPDYAEDEHLDNCLEVTGVPSIFDMIGPLLMIGMLAMLIPTMQEGMELK